MIAADSNARRSRLLLELGCAESTVAELLPYTRSIDRRGGPGTTKGLPLGDEPHLEAWRHYAAEAQRRGVWAVLRERLVQLAFPVVRGMSRTESYRRATRRGLWPESGTGLELRAPNDLELTIHPTSAGRVPVLVAGNRRDFVLLVQALTGRNEPVEVPDSMGASMVKGLNNWDRVARHRRAWEAGRGERAGGAAWREEFARLARRKELYQDCLIILGRGPYSAVDPTEMDLGRQEWLDRSLALRREHECFHYFTLRRFGSIRCCALDEILADLRALALVFGTYRSATALRFLGLDRLPEQRPDGRFQSYLGDPPLTRRGARAVARLTAAAAGNLEALGTDYPHLLREPERLERLLVGLCALSLEEIASPRLRELLVRELGGDQAANQPGRWRG